MNKELDIKRKLSLRGIFLIYNLNEIFKSSPFWIAIIITIIYSISSSFILINQKGFSDFLISKIDGLFPNLIGFSLGGYAIIVAFGNTDFLKKIAKSGMPYYEKLNAIFAFSILLQVFVLFISFVSQVFIEVTKSLQLNLAFDFCQLSNLCYNSFTLFFISWSLALIPYVVSNIFIFGETHHELLKNLNDN